MKLFWIDGIGPFFRGYQRRRINWSKIPFDNLETDGRFDPARFEAAREDFLRFADAVASEGFNGVTLDDLAHLTLHEDYAAPLREKIARYRDAYGRLFEDAAARGLTPYLTTDVVFAPRGRPNFLRRMGGELIPFFQEACHSLFRDFPAVGGVIFRMGECDARDVRGDFRSRLALRTPGEANAFLRNLLPVFERHRRLLVFRTWTVGAHRIGDLIWNRHTFERTFEDIESPWFVISMKPGETDFFRYLPLNRHFFRGDHLKMIELQARREYEGFGEFPSFIGWEYERYMRELAGCPHLAGAWIWCQTGGWSGFRRRAFLEPAGRWNEINAAVSLRILRDGVSAADAVRDWARPRMDAAAAGRLLTLLRLSDEVVREALYMDEFARRKLFFRRLRVPPLLHVYWDHILVNHSMRKLLRCFARHPRRLLAQSLEALEKIRNMRAIAAELGWPTSDFDFQYDTFEILAAARRYYFGNFGPEIVERLRSLRASYARQYNPRYHVRLDFSPFRCSRAQLRLAMALFFRARRGYRWLDRLVLIRLLSMLAPLFALRRRRAAGGVIHQAMGLQTVLK